MPLNASPVALDTLKAASEQLEYEVNGAEMTLDVALPDRLALAAPHPAYTLGLEDLLAERGLEAATETGWRYLMLDGEEPIGAVEVQRNADNGQPMIASVEQGGFSEEFARSVAYAEDLADVQERPYELRLLRSPAVYAVALWLRDETGERDFAIPLAPIARLEPRQAYPVADFLAALRQEARRIGDFDSTPQQDAVSGDPAASSSPRPGTVR